MHSDASSLVMRDDAAGVDYAWSVEEVRLLHLALEITLIYVGVSVSRLHHTRDVCSLLAEDLKLGLLLELEAVLSPVGLVKL